MSTGFSIFGLQVHYYGILIMVGAILAAFWLYEKQNSEKWIVS